MARIKNFNIGLDKSTVDTADKLRGEVTRSKYIQDALKTHNRRMAAKLRLNVDIQIEKPTTEEQHPQEEVKQAVRMGAV